MTPQEFAKMLRDTQACREASWDDDTNRYTKSFSEAANEVCPQPWPEIVAITLFAGYADVWDWCDAVDKLKA